MGSFAQRLNTRCKISSCLIRNAQGAIVQTTDYSAFGSTDPVYDRGGDRIRWFCPWYISDLALLERVLDTVADLQRHSSASRITVRVISKGDLSPGIVERLAGRGYRIEARMTLADGRVITYIARCLPHRRSAPGDVRNERALLEGITVAPRKGPVVILENFHRRGDFCVEAVRPGTLSPADTDRLIKLHRKTFPTFPYDFGDKLALMLNAPDCYLMSQVRSIRNGQIVAFSNLEINTVALDDGSDLCLAEYDNSMRAETCADHGEISGLGAILRLELAKRAARRGVDLCHAESRTGLAAINSISYHLGMHFGGMLEQHLLISGRSDVSYQTPSRFESMNVWYLNRTHLTALEGR
jgi:hypothetical protein